MEDGSAVTSGRKPPVAKEHEKKNGKRTAAWVLIALVFLVSGYLLAYTPVHDYFHSIHMRELIGAYDQAVSALPETEREALLQAALAYNDSLRPGAHFILKQEELDAYREQLDLTGTGMIGYIQIPKIGVDLPIYQSASAEVLEEAVGHVPGSSLPVGGSACHTVLCGHRDLSTAYLFHDLDKLKDGDTFTLTVLDRTITYQVDQVRIVLPKEIDDLTIENGRDYCTLVTCHPHGSSAYRMLVRGHRV